MPNTSFEEIYQEFLSKVQDYKMRNLFLSDVNVATNLLHSYLLKAIAKFTNCRKDIKNPDEKKGEFNVSLNLVEKDILTGLMVEAWMDRVILDITQMNLTLNDNDFKHYAEATNFDKKSEIRDKIREINAQDMWNYDFDNTNWQDWASGNYQL